MPPAVREMGLHEVDLILDYFHGASPEFLETLGVDPTRLPSRARWRERYAAEYEKAIEDRSTLLVIWELDGAAVGFSTADTISFGEEARMHLHVTEPELRSSGVGAACVRQTADFYFDALAVKRLVCEPNAFNVAPNRTLQAVGFKYVKTHMTVPGPINYRQAVTRWVLER